MHLSKKYLGVNKNNLINLIKSIKNKQRMYSTHFHSNNVEKINK